MAAVFQVISNSSGIFTATRYFRLASGSLVADATETNRQVVYRTAGTVSKVAVRVSTNATTGNSTFKVRINAADGNISITVTSGTTGVFEDNSNTDTVSSTDLLAYEFIPGSVNNVLLTWVRCLFAASSNTVIRYSGGGGVATAAQTRFYPLTYDANPFLTESSVRTELGISGTLKNLSLYVSSNARTTNTTLRTRINAGDGNLLLTVGSGATGTFEDTSNTDTIAATDEVNLEIEVGSGSGTINLTTFALDVENTSNKFPIIFGSQTTVNAGNSRHWSPSGYSTAGTSVAATSGISPTFDCTLSDAWLNVVSNSLNVNIPCEIQKNGVATAISITVTAGATGEFTDSSSDTFDEADLISWNTTAPAGSGSVILGQWSAVVEGPSSGITLDAGANTVTLTNPTATLTLGAATVLAGGQTVNFTNPAATLDIGSILSAGDQTINFSNPTATLALGAVTINAGGNTVVFTNPNAFIVTPSTGQVPRGMRYRAGSVLHWIWGR